MTNKKENILYFEGAGVTGTQRNDLENCRIRTAFINKEGKEIYLEVSSAPKLDRNYRAIPGQYWLHIDHLFEIVEGVGNENINGIKADWQDLKNNYNYSKEDLTKWINKYLGADFDTVEILPQYEGYKVHGENRGYNLIDNHQVNILRAKARARAYRKFNDLIKGLTGEKYPATHIEKMEDDALKVRFHGYQSILDRAGIKARDYTLKVTY